MRDIRVKICGLSRPEDVVAVAEAGAAYCGFVFFEKSPRNVTPEQARALAQEAPVGLAKVALVVDAEDRVLDRIVDTVPLDMLQLQGAETPERVAALRARHGLPVMKAVGLRDAADLGQLAEYEAVADQLLVDAKPPRDAALPGGNGLSFDWRLVAGRRFARPWMLAGGLTADNVAEAIAMTGTRQVDVSSGVEAARGVKDAAKIRAFVEAARSAQPVPRL
ncbi:phosphoribosylanthranilate isomerase [Pseudoponticoccus marisrubri]|uniref:N-(5'-phosphoribosyl)anthranilate isomerase n=1 Tax=Pseudoponticoccus marisrubri TaxID=1685382 RepID=A0A0W7WIY0_9RHOB|nr:phosphoribosylanthranilate isomerase [Pseudoponticoccus marisrubri]KUF10470.1 N-(5'-phosphoribosyl)anthranilate isomerase [Pseudoponticoccus marisrubri]